MADTAAQATQNTPSTPKSIKKTPAKNPIKTPQHQPEVPDVQSKMPSRVTEDDHSEIADVSEPSIAPEETETNGEHNGTEDNKTETPEDEDEGLETIQVGSVHDGHVIDSEGRIIGELNGEDVSQFEGSVVDAEGDVLDEEGNVIAQAHLQELASEAQEGAGSAIGETKEGAESALGDAKDGAESAVGDVKDTAEDVEKPELAGPFGVQDNGEITNATGVPIGKLVEGEPQDLVGTSIKEIDDEGNLVKASGSIIGKADLASGLGDKLDEGIAPSEAPDAESKLGEAGEKLHELAPEAELELDSTGNPIENLDEAEPKLDEDGNPIEEKLEEAEPKLDEAGNPIEEKLDEAGNPIEEPKLDEAGNPIEEKLDEAGNPIEDKLEEAEPKLDEAGNPIEEKLDEAGNPIEEPKLDEAGNPIEEKLDEAGEKVDEAGEEIPEVVDLSILEGKKVNKAGKIVDDQGNPWGVLIEGEAKKLFGKKIGDAEGNIYGENGKVIGRAELLPESERPDVLTSPFEDFPDALVEKSGNVVYEGQVIGKVVEGDAKALAGKKVDADGDILDKHGNVIGKAIRTEEEEPVPEPEAEPEDVSLLEGKKVNKAGNIVDDTGRLFGRLVTGDASKLVGKMCDAEGKIWSNNKVIGTAELLPVDEREAGSESPFEDFPDAVVNKEGHIIFDSVIVGRLVEGDAKKLLGKKVDKDGEIVDKIGNVIGKAERWEPEEEVVPEPEKIDMSALAGKRVNKLGNLVDGSGQIYGRVISGVLQRLVGRMADKNGNIFDEGGNVIGTAELVPEAEREGQKEGPFAGFENPTVTKDGKVADSKGAIIGRIVEGSDAKKLYGKLVDPDGDILDTNGNSIGKAERWEEEEKVKAKHPAAGRKVNKSGDVVDENGDIIAKLTDGPLQKCAGKEIDDDGDVVDGKGTTVGHVTLLEDIPEPEPEVVEEEPEEPEETEEEIEKRKQLAEDKKLAGQMAGCLEQYIDQIKPILKMIADAIDTAERQPKEELDEQKLVDTVKPLIEQGAGILQECNGVIRGLDPDGRISSGAKAHAAAREATPEEYRLADLLKELTAGVTQTIDQAKKKIAGMPHAKKELNPLWGLLAEPLGQIIAAVGLLLSGVLGLVGKLLAPLGLGGLLDNLLGGLGIKGILKGLGLGMVTEALTGKK